MPAPYSAGSIFVSVVPSFKDNQRDIAREYQRRGEEASKAFSDGFDKQVAKDLPKAMEKAAKGTRQAQEKSGDEAGKAYATGLRKSLVDNLKSAEKDLERALGPNGEIKVPVDADAKAFRNTFNSLVRDIRLTRADLEVGADVGQALYDVDRLSQKLKSLRDQSVDVETRGNLNAGLGAMNTAAARVRRDAAIEPDAPPQPVQRQQGAFESALSSRLRASIQALPPVEVDADISPAAQKIIEFRTDAMVLLDDLEADVALDGDDTIARARALMALLEGVIETADPTVEIDSSFNAAGALAQIKAWAEAVDPVEVPIEPEMGFFRARVAQALKAAGAALPEIKIDADADDAHKEMARIRAELIKLGEDVKIGMDLDDAREASVRLQRELGQLRRDTVDIEVDVDAARALVELEAIDRAADDADRALRGAGRGADDGANSFRAFSGVLLGLATIGPLAIPVIGAIGAGMLALGPLAAAGAAGLGVFALGVMGVSDAVKAMGEVQDNAEKDAKAYADGVRNAAKSVATAERSVAQARRAAADGAVESRERIDRANQNVERTGRQVVRAEDDLGDAQRDAQRAQEALTDAREAASERLIDLQMQIRGGALAERRAYMQLAESEVRYANALADPGATRTEREQLLLDLDEQKFKLDSVLLSNQRLGEESAEASRKGVEGSDEVVAAQGRIEDANERVADAQVSLADAQRSAAEAVADVAKAQAQAQRDAADAAQAITDAQARLADAQLDYADAVAATSASQDKLALSMAKLSPAGRAFAEYLFSLKGYFRELRDTAQAGLLPGVQEWMQDIIGTYGPQFVSIVGGMSTALGDMFRGFGEALQGPEWLAFFDMLEAKGPTFLGQMGEILTNLGTGLASLTVAFAPAAEDFGNSMVGASERFADWAAGLSETQGFREFMEWWERVGPKVMDFFSALAGAVVNLGVALAPYGEDLMVLVTAFLRFIENADPQVLGAIAVAIIGVVAAFQILVGLRSLIAGFGVVLNLASGAMMLLRGTAVGTTAMLTGIAGVVAIAVAALALIGVAIYLLWQNSETFRNIVLGVWDAIKAAAGVVADFFMAYVWPVMQTVWGLIMDVVTRAWNDVLKPIFDLWGVVFGILMGWLQLAWAEIGQPLFEMIMSIVQAVWSVLGPIFELIGMAFSALWALAKIAWDNVGAPLFGALIAIVEWLWVQVFDPVMRWIIEAFGNVMGFFKSAWETLGAPVFALLASVVEALVGVFQGSFDGIKGIWEALLDVLMSPIVFVVETVLNNGLIAGINHIAGIFTDDDTWIDPIPTDWIPGRAEGGTIPGTSPHKRADNVLIRATAGEYMQQVDAVDYYGVGLMDAMNQRLIPREALMAGLQGRAYGGMIDPLWNAVRGQFPDSRLTSHYRAGDSGLHGRRQAIDVGGRRPYPDPQGKADMLRIDQWIAQAFPNISQLIHTAPGAINLLDGKRHNYNSQTQAEHRDHVHIGARNMAALAGGSGEPGGGGDPWYEVAMDFITSPMDTLRGIITDAAGSSLDSSIGQMLINIPFDLAESLWSSLLDTVTGIAGDIASGVGSAVDWGLDLVGLGDDEQMMAYKPNEAGVRNTVQGVAGNFGWDSGFEWSALSTLIRKESSWNPTAQNPTSTAYGLGQFLNSTWATVGGRKTSDPALQAEYMMRYIDQRYGTPSAALAFHNRNNYYGHGGLIENQLISGMGLTPTLHDDGGVIDPGWNLIYNATRKPEASLNPTQLENIETIADRGGAPLVGEYHSHMMNGPTANEVADEFMHTVTVIDRGGKYE